MIWHQPALSIDRPLSAPIDWSEDRSRKTWNEKYIFAYSPGFIGVLLCGSTVPHGDDAETVTWLRQGSSHWTSEN